MKGYYTQSGYMGFIGNRYILFSSESDFLEYIRESEEDTSTSTDSLADAAGAVIAHWIWLTGLPRLGPVRQNQLLDRFGTAEALHEADEAAQRRAGLRCRRA